MTVAEIILQQLGGNKFISMVGAYFIVSLDDGLQFSIRAKAKDKINKIKIILNHQDTYNVEFWNVNTRKMEFKKIYYYEDIYVENLITLIELITGLSCKL